MTCRQIFLESKEYDKSIELRTKVLRIPLGLIYSSEDLNAEIGQIHLAAFTDEELIGILLLVKLPNQLIKMRQVAIDPAFQSIGIGTRLVEFAEDFARSIKCSQMTLHARTTARNFYLSLNYQTDEVVFEEVGIPHIKMWKYL
jgi:GNAT superfamily N-acetyltransferase